MTSTALVWRSVCIAAVAMVILPLCSPLSAFGASSPSGPSSKEEMIRLGERMYRTGILPSGSPVKAYVSGDVPVDGTSFTCVSCHLRSGLGSIEGEVVTPPTNGRILFQPRKPFIPGSEFVPSYSNYAKYLPERPAYTDETLSALILTGIDPTGRSVLKVMPRYDLNQSEMASMLAYLKSLSDQPPPGVTPQTISFATVIVEGTDPVAIQSMIAPLQFSIDRKNSLSVATEKNDRVARMGYNMLGSLSSLKFTLKQWTLKGAPATWRAQLEEYYRKEPVFALLGGISRGEWEPVHRFCEDNKIPNLFPVVEYPVLSDSDWYTLYFSRGVRQEGEAAARYLHGMSELFGGKPVVQIYRDNRKGQELAAGFRDSWKTVHGGALTEIRLAAHTKLTAKRLQQLVVQKKPAALVIWDDGESLAALSTVTKLRQRPGLVVASGTYMGKALWTVPEPLRNLVYFTYPYRLPQEDVRFDQNVKRILPGKSLGLYDQQVVRQSYLTGEVLGKALMMMRGEYYRDYLYDVIGMMSDMYYPLYERVSFGPGQRYASKGAYIVQLGKGANPQLERRSEWVIP